MNEHLHGSVNHVPDMPKDAKDIAISQGDKDMDINV